MAEEEQPSPQTLFEIMKYGKQERTAVIGALRMPHQLTSMDEDDMPTPKATKFSKKGEASASELQDTAVKGEEEPSLTNLLEQVENLGDDPPIHQSTPYAQQHQTKTYEEKIQFSKAVPPTSLTSILIDIPSDICIKIYNAVFELATAIGLIVTYGFLVIVIAVFIVPDSIWNAIWPVKPLELKEQMEKQNREEKELEKQLGYSDGHRRLLSNEISDLELEKVGMKVADEDKGKGREIIVEEKTAEVRDEKAS